MTAILAYSKGRAHSHRLRRVVQQTSAYVLASGSNVYVRWVPSEWNPADNPSRGRRSPSIPKKSLGDGPLQEPGSASDMAGEGDSVKEETKGAASTKPTQPSTTEHLEFGAGRDDPPAKEEKESCSPSSTGSSGGSGSRQYKAERSFHRSGNQTPLPDPVEGLCRVEKTQPSQERGSGPHCLPPGAVHERRGSISGQLCGGCGASSASGASRAWLPGKSSTVLEGLAQTMSSKKQDASSLRSSLFGRSHSDPTRLGAGSSGDVADFWLVPQADGVPASSSPGHRKKGAKVYKYWSVLLHPLEEGVPSKAQQWDEALTMDLDHLASLGPAMSKTLQLAKRSRNEIAFNVTSTDVNNVLQNLWPVLQLESLGAPHMYRLRHGGATFELANGMRSLQEVQLRGRWKALKSLKNYEKGGRLAQLFGSLSDSVQKQCVEASQQIHRELRNLP